MIAWWKFILGGNCSVLTHIFHVLRAKGKLLLHHEDGGTCCIELLLRWKPSTPSRCTMLVKRLEMPVYRRKFRERLGELTPRNLDHPVPVGLVNIGGRRALIYGHPWRGLSSHPVLVLHPADCKRKSQHCCFSSCVLLFKLMNTWMRHFWNLSIISYVS